MEINSAQSIGVGVMVLTSLLGAYYMILKIREHHNSLSDPSNYYVTQRHLDKLRSEIMRTISEATQDLRTLRAEIREDTRSIQRQHTKAMSEMGELISRNAQNISSLIAQARLANQRISELALKTDKLALKMKD